MASIRSKLLLYGGKVHAMATQAPSFSFLGLLAHRRAGALNLKMTLLPTNHATPKRVCEYIGDSDGR